MGSVVTGIGVVSALGMGVQDNLDALTCMKSGISDFPEILVTGNRLPVGEVKHSNEELATMLGLAKEKHISRTAMLGMLAAKEALDDACPDAGLRIGLVSSTSVGGMDLTEHFFADFMQDPDSGCLRDVVMHDCCASTDAIARYCGIKGYRTTVSTACSSAANALMIADRLISHGILDCVVAGGTDALSAFTMNGFKSLRILDTQRCRPFDSSRAGLNLGEGAGYVVLMREDLVTGEGYCRLSGYANKNDANHQTAVSENGQGAYLAMSEALDMAGVAHECVSYVNVHGTGTLNNDSSESAALKRIFGDNVPPFSSTKGYTGHTLAAAGGIEAVFSVLSIRDGVIWPNLGFETQADDCGLSPQVGVGSGNDVRCVVSNSFGFGGNCSSLVFVKD